MTPRPHFAYEYEVNGCKSFVCSGYSTIVTVTVGAGSCTAGSTTTTSPTGTTETNPEVVPDMPPTC
ncbi:MAG TPA: hypothetical protein VFK24_03470 [Gammaproteobacteria bacterium]|nr:hypothetical protein [Gammaproteobacteria bacterium]